MRPKAIHRYRRAGLLRALAQPASAASDARAAPGVRANAPPAGLEHAVDEIGTRAWQVRAKIGWRLLDGVTSAQGQRDGNADGVLAAVNRVAARLGVSPRTIREDQRIYRLLIAPLTSESVALVSGAIDVSMVGERTYWQIAASTPDPMATLHSFAERKSDNPFYEPADARRDVAEEMERKQFEARQERLTDIAAITINPLTGLGLFNVILADPPWRYEGATTSPDLHERVGKRRPGHRHQIKGKAGSVMLPASVRYGLGAMPASGARTPRGRSPPGRAPPNARAGSCRRRRLPRRSPASSRWRRGGTVPRRVPP